MRVEEVGKLTRAQLRDKANECFRLAELTSTIDKPALLLEAQFYMRELERRFDSRASLRDLILEVIVIALIGWEIHMSYRHGPATEDLDEYASQLGSYCKHHSLSPRDHQND